MPKKRITAWIMPGVLSASILVVGTLLWRLDLFASGTPSTSASAPDVERGSSALSDAPVGSSSGEAALETGSNPVPAAARIDRSDSLEEIPLAEARERARRGFGDFYGIVTESAGMPVRGASIWFRGVERERTDALGRYRIAVNLDYYVWTGNIVCPTIVARHPDLGTNAKRSLPHGGRMDFVLSRSSPIAGRVLCDASHGRIDPWEVEMIVQSRGSAVEVLFREKLSCDQQGRFRALGMPDRSMIRLRVDHPNAVKDEHTWSSFDVPEKLPAEIHLVAESGCCLKGRLEPWPPSFGIERPATLDVRVTGIGSTFHAPIGADGSFAVRVRCLPHSRNGISLFGEGFLRWTGDLDFRAGVQDEVDLGSIECEVPCGISGIVRLPELLRAFTWEVGVDSLTRTFPVSAEGTFQIDPVLAGNRVVQLVASHEPWTRTTLGTVTVEAGQLATCEFAVPPPSVITGRCEDEQGRPVLGSVLATDGKSFSMSAEADAHGRFVIFLRPQDQVESGSTSLRATRPGWMSESVPIQFSSDHQIDHHILVLRTGLLAQGVVQNRAGIPLEGWLVMARSHRSWNRVLDPTVTAADGTFELTGLETGFSEILLAAPEPDFPEKRSEPRCFRFTNDLRTGEPIVLVIEDGIPVE